MITTPNYRADQALPVLQQVQLLVAEPRTVTLIEVEALLCELRRLHGNEMTLEQVIQKRVGQQLAAQQLARQDRRREAHHG